MQIFGGGRPKTNPTAVAGLQIQSSTQGLPIPLVFGTNKIAPNLIWYGDFLATAQQSSAGSGGGKGGVGGGGGGKGGGGGVSYTYQAALAFGLCMGTIKRLGRFFVNKEVSSAPNLGYSEFYGSTGQNSWGYLSTNHPDQALSYRGLAYIANVAYQMGNSPQIPNHNVEIYGLFSDNANANGFDADPTQIITYLLSDAKNGAGFPSANIGNFNNYQSYVMASGLWVSPAYVQQTTASTLLNDLALATNSEFVYSGDTLNLVPYGDSNIAANGYTYTAPSAPIYNLTDDDFTRMAGEGSVMLDRANSADAYNSINLECLDRNNQYNPAVVNAKDSALIDTYGVREKSVQAHYFADLTAGRLSAQLQVQREARRNKYSFTLDHRYVLLDVMDIVSLAYTGLGLNAQWVRIESIDENDDGNFDVVAEEYLAGNGNAAQHNFQNGTGFAADYNSTAGNINAPVIFEPTAQLSESLQVWLAASGGANWGGCEVWVSNDGDSYRNIGRITGGSRTGELSADLQAYQKSQTNLTIDEVNTLRVDLSESRGELLSSSLQDTLALNSACYVDGEYIAYRDATLTAANQYDLSYLVRGVYGSATTKHLSGAQFSRLDESIFKFDYTQDYIGKTIYLKFTSFNIYGGGLQTLTDVEPYAYKLQGTAATSALASVANLRASYIANITQVTWDEIKDFRSVMYEVRKGATAEGGQIIGRYAHPPFTAQGNGTYWVAAISQLASGLTVYSEAWQAITITGAQISQNIIAAWDEHATGWTGTLSGTAGLFSGEIRTTGAGNVLAEPDFLGIPDVYNYGGAGTGYYEIPVAHQIDVGRVTPCDVLINWSSIGQRLGDDVLTVADFLNENDIFDSAASANTIIYPEIALYDGASWGAWQKFTAGKYNAQKFKARMYLASNDLQVIAILQEFVFSVDVPDRNDHYNNVAISSGGTTITWQPDGAGSTAAFNGGNGGANLPNVQVTILNAQAGDDVILSSLSLSSGTVQVVNGGSGVARNVNILAQGY